MARCVHIKSNGRQCEANALPGETLCTFHHPIHREATANGRRQGGLNGCRPRLCLPENTEPLPLKTVGDLVDALGDSFNRVRVGTLDPKVGNALAYIGATLLRALQGSETEERLRQLEERLEQQLAAQERQRGRGA